jgi:hypothetical protein
MPLWLQYKAMIVAPGVPEDSALERLVAPLQRLPQGGT